MLFQVLILLLIDEFGVLSLNLKYFPSNMFLYTFLYTF